MRTLALVTLVLIATTTVTAHAGTCSPSINARQHRQTHRIHQGVRGGELTPWEWHRLLRTECEIRRDECAAKRDGKLTPRERLKLQRELNHSSRQIYRLKHNCAER